MPKTRVQKGAVVDELVKEFKDAKSVTFANYQGMTVSQVDSLRKKMRESNVHYLVAKKTLFTRAAKEAGFELDAKQFPGMIGAAFGTEDEVAPAKVVGDFVKTTPIKIVGGIFEGVIVPMEKMIALSKLPGKKELLGMLVGTMYAPVSAFVRALNAIRESKEAPAPAAAPVVETPVAEAPIAPAVESPAAPVAEAPAAPAVEVPVVEAPVTLAVEAPVVEAPVASTSETPAEPGSAPAA
jgi:large subunit ribosomal protein L10